MSKVKKNPSLLSITSLRTMLSLIFFMSSLLSAEQIYAEQKQSDNLQHSLSQSNKQAQADIDEHRKQAEEEVQKTIIPDAVVVLEETQKAIDALAQEGKEQEAIRAIEQATGKINILLARHPEKSLLPARYKVKVVDVAPVEIKAIKEIDKAAEEAVKEKNYPHGRLLLKFLRSEINIRSYCLPLAVYPDALKQAAYLLNQKKTQEARLALIAVLKTMVVIDQILPLPVIYAQSLLEMAEKYHLEDKEVALKLLAEARHELERAKELGYFEQKDEYSTLLKSVEDLERHIKGNRNSFALFHNIKDKLVRFLKHPLKTKKGCPQ